ncbi:beta-glucan synthesis-associated protein [Elasticomyces elasticus]|nr:beta-glucan synthesis-associated protein [Elasticomyces elasticus]
MSSPLPKALSRTSSQGSIYRDAQDDGGLSTQAGRSSSNLHAQASAAQLREADRSRSHGPARSTSSPNLLRKKSRPQSALGDTPQTQSPRPVRASSSRQPSPAAPAVSSPLNPISSNTSSESRPASRRPSDEAATSSNGASKSTDSIGMHVPPPGPPRTRPTSRVPTLQPPEMSQRASSLNASRVVTPRSVRDLGQDYTRYFSPFAASQNNSSTDLNTPLPRFHSQTNLLPAADLAKRLSNPFEDSKRLANPYDFTPRAASTPSDAIDNADPEKNFFPYLDDRLAAPGADRSGYTFPLYWDEKEDDDDMHMPAFDDDVRMKPKFKDHFRRENIASTLGMMLMIAGLLLVFIVLPVISFSGVSLIHYSYETPLDQMGGPWQPAAPWAIVNHKKYPLMSNIRTGLIDPDTPKSAMTRKSVDGDTMKLVFSDEFNAQNRTFYPGDDPFWFGFDGWYGATQDLEWYDPDAINTGDGTLQLQLDAFPNHNLQFRSGMLNSWNQLCFKGGAFEVSVSLPGPAGVHGLWPGAWTMGNLGRPGYLATTDGLWPYTYNTCDTGITPNQSMPDGTSRLPGQKLPSCTCAGEDHPSPGTGRGAPEIDILEVSGDWGGMGVGVATQSYQVAPFDIFYYPNYNFMETPDYSTSFVNTYTGGPYQQAVSTTSMLNNSWYDGNMYQKYAFEYTPGSTSKSEVAWFVGDGMTMRFDARAIGPNGNIGQRLVSEEPMSLILNLGISNSWVDINWAALKFPTVYRIDYVRWYQKEGESMVTCDPPGYETTQYIKNHPAAYQNPNFTHWSDAGYNWPKNKLMSKC